MVQLGSSIETSSAFLMLVLLLGDSLLSLKESFSALVELELGHEAV